MEKTSKITEVTANGSFNSQHGTMYKFEVAFENGEFGDANCKAQDQKTWVVGEEVTYTLAPNANPKYNGKLTRIKENPVNGSSTTFNAPKNEGVQKMIVAQNSVTNAVNYHKDLSPHAEIEDVLKTAEKFFNWVLTKGV